MQIAGSEERQVSSPASFEDVASEHLPMIRRLAAAHEADPDAQDDLVQDILCALWRALPGFRGDGSMRGFVARIAANRAVTHVQRSIAAPPTSELTEQLPSSVPSPETCAILRDQHDKLLAALRVLPIALREPVVLTLEGLSQTEIATVLGLTPNAVAIRMHRARSALRELLENRHDI
jgi:RNA polymerase sigma-70 factor (ECF subfamily)